LGCIRAYVLIWYVGFFEDHTTWYIYICVCVMFGTKGSEEYVQ